MRSAFLTLLLVTAAFAGEKKLPSGEAANELVSVQGTVLDDDHLQQIFSSDFDHTFVVVEVTLTPKGDKPLDIRLDDFLLRSEQSGANTGPLQAAQIAGQGGLVLNRGEAPRRKGGFGVGLGGMMGGGSSGGVPQIDNAKVESKDDREQGPLLGMLKRKILTEKAITEPVTALLFFPLEKEKPKNLALVYTTTAGKLRFKFK
jgi:hypothetical protein